MSWRSHVVASLTVCALQLPPGVAAPQTAEDESPREFFDSLQVNVVNVEVFVEDRKGDPVTDLSREDFELLVDGRPVPISNFYASTEEVLTGRPQAGQTSEPQQTAPVIREQARADRAKRQNQLIFYVDNFNLRPTDRNRVLRYLQRFVSRAALAGTEMMLMTYDHSLSVRQPFTADPRLIVDAALDAEQLSGLAVGRDADRRIARGEIDDAHDELAALSAASAYADAHMTELAAPLEALSDLMEPLSGLSGRKALVYISSGLPKRVGEDLFVLVENRFPESRARMRSFLYDLTPKYRNLVLAANTAGVTLYALDATGLQSFESLSAAEGGSIEGGSYVEIDSVYQANLQAPLQQLAVGTGGRALTNSNNLELMFGQLQQDLTTFYSLGYRASPGDEGRYKDIEVKVDRPRVRVRHREGSRVLSQERKLEQGLIAALQLGQGVNQFDVHPVVGDAASGPDNNFRVPLDVRIPLSRVTLAPNGDQWLGRVVIGVRAMDESGRMSEISRSQPLELRIPATEYDAAMRQYVTWSVELLMRKGRQRVAIGVADLLSGQLGFTTDAVAVPNS